MYRLCFALLVMTLGVVTVFGVEDEPSSVKGQEGKVVYIPVLPAVSVTDEFNIQKEDQNSTGHGKAK